MLHRQTLKEEVRTKLKPSRSPPAVRADGSGLSVGFLRMYFSDINVLFFISILTVDAESCIQAEP